MAVCSQEMAQPFSLFQAANEEDVQLPVTELLHRRDIGGEGLHVDAVGDYVVITGERPSHELHGWPGDGDPAVELIERPLEKRSRQLVSPWLAVTGVKGGHINRVR